MKYIPLILLLVSTYAFSVKYPEKSIDADSIAVQDILEIFKQGAVLRTPSHGEVRLPKGSDEEIISVLLENDVYEIIIKTDECGGGFEVLYAKYTCSTKHSTCEYLIQRKGVCVVY